MARYFGRNRDGTYRSGVYPADTFKSGHVAVLVQVELQSGFDEPYGVGEGARDEAGTRRLAHVHHGGIGRKEAVPEEFRLGIRGEVDGPRRGHTYEVRAQACKEEVD